MEKLSKIPNILNSVFQTATFMIFLFLISISDCLAAAIPQNITFRNYKIEDGLSQSSVFAITQDADGFMWFGTRDGLNRFDSRRFKVYRSLRGDSTSIASNEINCLTVDAQKRLWVGTRLGLHIYNKITDDFIRVRLTQQERHTPLESIRGLLVDSKGRLWVLSGTRVFVSDGNVPTKFEMLEMKSINGQAFRRSIMRNIFEDSNGTIWISNNTDLYRVDQSNSGKYDFQKVEFSFKKELQNLRVNSIIEYPKGKLWLGTDDSGVILIDLSRQTQEQFLKIQGNTNSLTDNQVRNIVVDNSGKMWIGTIDGISIFDPISQEFINVKNNPDNNLSLSANSITSLYKDNSGSIWIGTYHGGINLYSKYQFSYSYYKNSNNDQGLSMKIVSSIEEDSKSNLWIGTEGGGLDYFNRETGTFKYLTTSSKQTPISHNNTKCLYLDNQSNLWIGTSGGGLDILDTKTNKIKYYLNDPKNDKSIGSNWIYSILEDKNKTVWLGSYGDGLDRYFRNTGEFKHYNKNDGEGSISSNSIRSMIMDSKGRVWIGTSNGLCRYVEETDRFITYSNQENDSTGLSSDDIYCIHEDQNHNIWIGTYGGGLDCFNEKTGKFRSFSIDNGLPGNIIYGILEDNSGYLWLSTNNGLTRFDPKKMAFRSFDGDDGLPGDEYNYNSYFKTKEGELFFGGKNGLISFDPNQISVNEFQPNVVLTGLRLFNRKVEINDNTNLLSNNISSVKAIKLKYNQNIITFEFSTLNFINPLKNKFAYKLIGLDADWNYTSIPEATYMNLNPGQYTLLVKGSNNDGVWNENPTSLQIQVLPPFWKSVWAYIFYFLLSSGALILIINFQRSRSNLKHRLDLESIELDRQNELHQLKLKYFTDISHEIRTPLTLILTPLENLLTEYKGDSILYKHLYAIKNNADRLLRLVNQIMDFRKQETGKLKLRIAEGNIVKFIKEISLAFYEESKRRELTLSFEATDENIMVWYDRDEMEKVFFNILSNAHKFANKGGNISIAISTASVNLDDKGHDFVRIEIRNSGKGIPAEKLDLIFDRFYQVDKQELTEYGTGIGLALSKGIIELHSGKISVDSQFSTELEPGFTCFSVLIPLGKVHIAVDQIIEHFKNSESVELYELLNENDVEEQIPHSINKISDLSTVLLVEDNVEIRNLISDSLSEDFNIVQAENGQVGWEIAVESIPDLVISDVVMPVMDGLELCERLKSDDRTSHIPVILLTARTALIHKLGGLKTGADDYLTKPFNIQVLRMRINNLIDSRRKLRKKFGKSISLIQDHIDNDSTRDEIFLKKAAEVLDQQMMDQQFSVNRLATELGMSQSVLYRKIKALTDLSPNDFIKNIRLNKAAQILLNEDLTVSDAGYKVGFNDSKYFSRSFKKQFGLNPSEFQRLNKK